MGFPMRTGSPKRQVRITLSSELKFDDSALQAYHGGVSSVAGAQFREDVSDLAFYGFFTDRKMRGNLFIGIPFSNQTQNEHFCRAQRVIRGMLRKLKRNLWRNRLFPDMYRPNRFQQFLVQQIF